MRRSHITQSDCSRRHSKVSSEWLPSYIKATRPVLEIFKWLDTFRTALVSLGLRQKIRVDISWSRSEKLRVPWPKTENLCISLSKAETTRVMNSTSVHYNTFYLLQAHKKSYKRELSMHQAFSTSTGQRVEYASRNNGSALIHAYTSEVCVTGKLYWAKNKKKRNA